MITETKEIELRGLTVEQASAVLSETEECLRSLGCKGIALDIEIEDDYGAQRIRTLLIGRRNETQAELAALEKIKEESKEYRRKTFEALKKEFEGK